MRQALIVSALLTTMAVPNGTAQEAECNRPEFHFSGVVIDGKTGIVSCLDGDALMVRFIDGKGADHFPLIGVEMKMLRVDISCEKKP